MSGMGDYRTTCGKCRWCVEWKEKSRWMREALPGRPTAYLCVNPERVEPVRVGKDEAPCNPCASPGARSCPKLAGKEG